MKLHVGIGTAADEIETVEILCYDNLEERDRGWKKTGRGKDRKYCNLFGMGLPVYHIDRMVEETGRPFGEASHILYVNGTYRGDDPMGRLMHDFFCTEAGDMHYGILAERVRYFKRTEEGVKAMSEAMEELAKKWAEEEVQEEREAVVFRMLETGETDLEKIAKVAKLSVEAVERLAKLQPV